ncbi:MAG: pantetheine-phosphate adenylyltransferase [Armatimonadetes bacterium]|nr:pantetheine-phosphate adenylyltransferase [Armatimonadota bacterium]
MGRPSLAIYPGTFDPFTYGHLDVAERAARLFESLIIAVSSYSGKSPLFTVEERVEMAAEACAHLPNVRVEPFFGLVVDFARQKGARAIVKGLRAVSDFEREMQMALMNRSLAPEVDTLLLVTDYRYAFLSSSLIKEICSLGGDVSAYVPAPVLRRLEQKLQTGRDCG